MPTNVVPSCTWLHPSTLQANLGPSFAQWTPFMATRQGATTSMAIKGKSTTFKTKRRNIINQCENQHFG
jgi:hypothetical protein